MFRASSCPSSGATTTAVAASGLPSELGDSSAVGRGRAVGPTTTNSMAMGMPETCSAVFKRQAIHLRSCCIWLVDSVESMMMHGPANPKDKKTHGNHNLRK
jgi:hypothetical protein